MRTDIITLMAYKSAIKRERKRLEPQINHLHNVLHIGLDDAVKNAVADYFASILCQFDNDIYTEAKFQVIAKGVKL